jgi:hypothetical protein
MKPPLPLSKAEREAALLHRRIAHERCQRDAIKRDSSGTAASPIGEALDRITP